MGLSWINLLNELDTVDMAVAILLGRSVSVV